MSCEGIVRAIDVFCGCGGLTVGLRNAGFVVLAGIENNEAARTAYHENYPDIHLFGDIRSLKVSDILQSFDLKAGDLDLLAGCSPCQGFSRMRTRNRATTVDDDRNDLVLEYVRLVEGLLPKALFFENVPGLTHDRRFGEMISRLKKCGFTVEYDILNMMNYEVPQSRRRLILVASRFGKIGFPEQRSVRLTVRSAISHLPTPRKSNDLLHKSLATHSQAVIDRIRKVPKNGGSRKDLGEKAQLRCHQDFDGYKDVYGRMAWGRPAPTITRYSINPSKGRYLHPVQNREITLREAALLQTFPPDYVFPLEQFGRFAVASMIGEALPPRFAELLGTHIRNHLLLAVPNLVHKAATQLATLSSFASNLPWRRDRTPYRIFLAEFLLVRTRSDVVAAIFEDVYHRFPSPFELALTPLEDIGAALAPLGLHKRVPVLLRAAQFIQEEFGGEIPSDPIQLMRIPGIKNYTAAAVCAFAFGQPLVPADVNVLRFLSRLTGLEMEHRTKGSQQLRELLPLLARDKGGPSAEILLDFSRLVCKPRRPLCSECVLREICTFAVSGQADQSSLS